MPLNNHRPHHGDSVVYGTAGLPWVTGSAATSGSAQRWDFPKVSKSLTIRNTDTTPGNGIYVAWTENGVNGTNRYLIPGGEESVFDVRCKSIWILAAAGNPVYSVFASLTTVDSGFFPTMTGSLLTVSGTLEGENWQGIG